MMVVKSNEKKQEERPAGLFFQYTRFKREKTIVKCHGDFLQAKSQLSEIQLEVIAWRKSPYIQESAAWIRLR